MKFKFNLKEIFFLLLFVLLLGYNFSPTFCNDHYNPDYDDIDYSDINFDEWDNLETRAGSTDLMNAIILLAPQIETPLWKETKPPKGRDVLYLLPHKLSALEYGGIVLNLFFNYTNKMAFSPDETLKLGENAQLLEQAIEELNKIVKPNEASSLIPLFKKVTIQERKIGGLLQAGFFKGPFTFQLNTSLQISERNFWLNKKDKQQIKEIFENLDSSFDEKELYIIRYGMGDTRLKAGLNTLNMSSFQMDIGFEGIIPTSKVSNLPSLENKDINFENIQNSMSEILGAIRDNLIKPRLGNNGHYGLGCYVETKLDLFHNSIHLWNRLSFDNLFPAQEDRLISSKQTIQAPANNPEFLNEMIAYITARNFGPPTEFIKQYIFPPPYRVTIKPGGILNFISNISFDLGRKWIFGLGYDFYLQQRERFDKIHNENIEPSSLRIEDAASDMAYQHKIFTEANYIKKQKKYDLNLGIGGDYTISSKHIGHDWTIFVRLGVLF